MRTTSPTSVASLEAAPRDVDAVAHRIVHGGERFRDPVRSTIGSSASSASSSSSRRSTTRLRSRASRGARERFPDVPHVAVFDTAFHATLPDEASTYARAGRWRDDWGIRRYGFHGLSVQWAAEQVRGGASRRLPSRRRLFGDRRARRTIGRHDDGLQPARRRAHGDALRLDRQRDRPPPASPRADVGRGDRACARARIGTARPIGDNRTGRRARAVRRPASPARARRLRPSRRRCCRRDDGFAGRARCAGLHGRDRRRLCAGARRRVPPARLPRRRARPEGEPSGHA